MLNKKWVDRDPVLAGQHLAEAFLGLFGGSGAHDAEAVRDPMHVRVDGDRRDPVAEHEHAVRRLRADPGHRRQLFEGPGRTPAEPVAHFDRDPSEDAGLGVVEPGPVDKPLDLPHRGLRQGVRVRVPGEQVRAGDVGGFVPRALGEDRPDQHLERILRVVAEVRDPPVAGPVEPAQSVEECLPRKIALAHAGPPLRPGGDSTPGSERSGSTPPSGRMSSPIR